MLKNFVRRWLGLVTTNIPQYDIQECVTTINVRVFQVRGGRIIQAARIDRRDPHGLGVCEEPVFVPVDANLNDAIRVELVTLMLRGAQ